MLARGPPDGARRATHLASRSRRDSPFSRRGWRRQGPTPRKRSRPGEAFGEQVRSLPCPSETPAPAKSERDEEEHGEDFTGTEGKSELRRTPGQHTLQHADEKRH